MPTQEGLRLDEEKRLSSPSHSRQELVKRDRQVADTDACGVIDGVGDGSGGANDPYLADPLFAPRADVRILPPDPGPIAFPPTRLCPHVGAPAIIVFQITPPTIHH